MGTYQQMGHNTDNLLFDPDLSGYKGTVLSPINHELSALVDKSKAAGHRGHFDVLFDPQLYYPKNGRGHLPEWGYYPSDLETADLSSIVWWNALTDKLIADCDRVRPDAICSPAMVPPRESSPDYFATIVEVGTYLHGKLEAHQRSRAIQTAIVDLDYLAAKPSRPLETASILSRTPCGEIYLVLGNDTQPRREFKDDEQLLGAMRLISALQAGGHEVIVAFSNADMVLWKAAGASHCGTGKYFNLRRFAPNRFEDDEPGGGPAQPYLFEEALLAFLRAADIVNLQRTGIMSQSIATDHLAREFVRDLEESGLNLAWRQYLRWFMTAEGQLNTGLKTAADMVATAAANWQKVEKADIAMAEPKNDGAWIPAWQKALAAFAK